MPRARRRTALALAAVAVVLVPWTVYVTARLPADHDARHWALAWGGFDVALVLAAGTTAYACARRPGWVVLPAAITGTLLVCDAWFDVLTARAGGELLEAVLEAAVAEIPLAVLCFWLARSAQPSRRATSPPRTPE